MWERIFKRQNFLDTVGLGVGVANLVWYDSQMWAYAFSLALMGLRLTAPLDARRKEGGQ